MNATNLVITAVEPTLSRESELSAQTDPAMWVDAHGDCLYRFALSRVRNPEIAKDLVQETLLAAVRTRDKFAGRSAVRTWLIGILKNKIFDYFRKLGRETSFTDLSSLSSNEDEWWDSNDHWIPQFGPTEWQPEGETAMKQAEFWQALQECLERLPHRIAQVFIMREIDDVPGKEVCNVLNISEANLWVMLHRARMALRRDLEATFFKGKGCTVL